MEISETNKILSESKNVCLIPSQEPEAIACTMALFYTLKEMGKNVNLIVDSLPENLKFLSPSLDFISYPKNFVVSIPNSVANISQIYYEKNPDALKIHLTVEKGSIKKDNIAFYYSEPKPDAIITIGIKDYLAQLKDKMDSFGFLLDAEIINIDSVATNQENVQENKKFGKINLIEQLSLAEIISAVIKNSGTEIKKETATSLLTAVILYTDNFKKNITPEIFQLSAELMKEGANVEEVTKNLFQ
jgi:nanoRNase/pAp phosphatase (c-di-AMP/oligoRNAs hydrolase)